MFRVIFQKIIWMKCWQLFQYLVLQELGGFFYHDVVLVPMIDNIFGYRRCLQMFFFLSFEYYIMCFCRLERKVDIGIEYSRIVGSNFGTHRNICKFHQIHPRQAYISSSIPKLKISIKVFPSLSSLIVSLLLLFYKYWKHILLFLPYYIQHIGTMFVYKTIFAKCHRLYFTLIINS